MTNLKSLTQESLQAEMDEWAANVNSATGWTSAYHAASECARIAAARGLRWLIHTRPRREAEP